MIHRASVAVAVRVILVALAGSPAGPLQAGGKPTVVATFSVLGDMVANVAGDHANLVTIVGPDGDPELYRPTLADGRTIAGARIVFTNDLNDDFEPWLEAAAQAGGLCRHQGGCQPGRANDHCRGGASYQRKGSGTGDRSACLDGSQEGHRLR